jgi:hypothetical protein
MSLLQKVLFLSRSLKDTKETPRLNYNYSNHRATLELDALVANSFYRFFR